jgi:hypothetical protein
MLLIIIKFLLSFHLWIHLKSGIASTFLIKSDDVTSYTFIILVDILVGETFEVLRMGMSLYLRINY